MKKVTLTVMVFLLFASVCFSQRTTLIGKCKFYYEKDQPKYTTIIGAMKVYHNGDLKKKGVEGKYDLWTCSGTVWVIFDRRDAAERNRFISGSVQTCNNF